MDELPVDTHDPAVKNYLHLIRLQVLTPLSLLINVAAVGVCQFIVSPGLARVTRMHPTSLTPSSSFLGLYITALYVMQIGYCVLLILVRKSETKDALIKGSGFALVLANWVMGLWAIAWVFKAFIISTILLGILVILLLSSNLALAIYHPETPKRPLDAAFIHAPIRLFLLLPLLILLPVSIFITEGHTWKEGDTAAYNSYRWEGFGVFWGLHLLCALCVIIRRDIVVAVGSAWLSATVWHATPKSTPVLASAIIVTFLHPVLLIISMVVGYLRSRRQGAIALPPDDGDFAGLPRIGR